LWNSVTPETGKVCGPRIAMLSVQVFRRAIGHSKEGGRCRNFLDYGQSSGVNQGNLILPIARIDKSNGGNLVYGYIV
jgi:hypothetical protein